MLLSSYFMYEVLWLVIKWQLNDMHFDMEEMSWDFAQCVMFTAIIFIINWIYEKWHKGLYSRSIVEYATIIVVNIIAIFIVDKVLYEGKTTDTDLWDVIDIYVICIICSLISIIDIQHFYYKRYITMKRELAGLRLNLLQQQLSPHFMFNSLSTLQGLIATNKQKAEEYVASLSQILRYITGNIGKEEIPVADALVFIKNYIKMLDIRFPEHFVFHIDDRNLAVESSIVPVSLQLTVENAVKHNVHSPRTPLEINISFNAAYVEVSNVIQRTAFTDSLGVGLKNLNERYRLLMDRELEIKEIDNIYSVKIPLRYESTDSRR